MTQTLLCSSGHHTWLDPEDRQRCCNPLWVRVQSVARADLESIGAEHIVYRQMWRGWKKVDVDVRQLAQNRLKELGVM
jgi:hypothetical protein